MAVALKLSDDLIEAAKTHAAAEHRSVPQQIEAVRLVANELLAVGPHENSYTQLKRV